MESGVGMLKHIRLHLLLPAKWTVERNDIKVSETVTK